MTITLAILALLFGCSGAKTQPAASEPINELGQQVEALIDATGDNVTPPIIHEDPEPTEPDARTGTLITVTGTARNAKMGAVVVTDNGPYYLQGMQEWSEEFNGKQVSVAGTLGSAKLAPDPVPTAKGEQNPGMFGTSQVLAEAQVTLVEETPTTP